MFSHFYLWVAACPEVTGPSNRGVTADHSCSSYCCLDIVEYLDCREHRMNTQLMAAGVCMAYGVVEPLRNNVPRVVLLGVAVCVCDLERDKWLVLVIRGV